jgi:hypothetical protein
VSTFLTGRDPSGFALTQLNSTQLKERKRERKRERKQRVLFEQDDIRKKNALKKSLIARQRVNLIIAHEVHGAKGVIVLPLTEPDQAVLDADKNIIGHIDRRIKDLSAIPRHDVRPDIPQGSCAVREDGHHPA